MAKVKLNTLKFKHLKQNKTPSENQTLSETLKSITGNNLGKYKLLNKIKATKKKLKPLSKKLLLQKFQH
nr:hypothetical protein [Mycoplasmopsis bovis]